MKTISWFYICGWMIKQRRQILEPNKMTVQNGMKESLNGWNGWYGWMDGWTDGRTDGWTSNANYLQGRYKTDQIGFFFFFFLFQKREKE